MNMVEFSRDVIQPMVLRGIERGDFDNVIGEMLAGHARGDLKFDEKTVRAMIARAYIVVTSAPPVEKWFASNGDTKIGAQLRIKMPPDEFQHP